MKRKRYLKEKKTLNRELEIYIKRFKIAKSLKKDEDVLDSISEQVFICAFELDILNLTYKKGKRKWEEIKNGSVERNV